MIQTILKPENVKIEAGAEDWKDAIQMSANQLIQQGYIEQQYVDTIIELTLKNGAYYLLTPDIALIHARPEDGVNQKQLAVTLFRSPVWFEGKSSPTALFITLAASDTEQHLDALKQVAELLSDDSNIQAILKASDEKTLYNIFTSTP